MGGIAWTEEEDYLLKKCIEQYGEGKWHRVPQLAGLSRCRKSCRLRWLNYLRPNIKRGSFTEEEVELIVKLHNLLGNRWSLIAGRLPGRTANDVKNYWNCHLSKRLNGQGIEGKPNPTKKESPRSSKSGKVAATPKEATILAEAPNWKPPQEENSESKGMAYADQYGQSQEVIQYQIQQCNQSLSVEGKGNMGLSNLQMDFQFDQEIKIMEDEDGWNGRELWDDWISDMDLWIDSL